MKQTVKADKAHVLKRVGTRSPQQFLCQVLVFKSSNEPVLRRYRLRHRFNLLQSDPLVLINSNGFARASDAAACAKQVFGQPEDCLVSHAPRGTILPP